MLSNSVPCLLLYSYRAMGGQSLGSAARRMRKEEVRYLSQLGRSLEAAIDKSGVKVDDSTHSDLAETMTKQYSAVARLAKLVTSAILAST